MIVIHFTISKSGDVEALVLASLENVTTVCSDKKIGGERAGAEKGKGTGRAGRIKRELARRNVVVGTLVWGTNLRRYHLWKCLEGLPGAVWLPVNS
ncbi:hypothetical protein J2Z49_000085 [Desulfofundulus luciae]|uniref:Uncharacterized protein n=1 Tax=Desulfofundulus luciae TaxID=74702 RepID=A0ABU0AYA3_9FIRM|nr:hypothetical protein [Desulfofundulus luciae]